MRRLVVPPAPELVDAVLTLLESLDLERASSLIVAAIAVKLIVCEDLEIERDSPLRHLTLERARTLNRRLEHREHDPEEHRNDGDHDEQFDERECSLCCMLAHPSSGSLIALEFEMTHKRILARSDRVMQHRSAPPCFCASLHP